MRFLLACILVGLCAPHTTEAVVRISEIAWMGTGEDANNEWIELYNDGSEQDLTGWTLVSADGQPTIALSGTIAANGHFLLERTDDTSVPDVAADLIYTGALGNDGEILTLTDSSGNRIDYVDGSEWSIGGDNARKYTPQRNGNGWVTAEPTPRAANATESVELPETAETSSAADSSGEAQTTSSSGNSGSVSKKTAAASTPPTSVTKKPEPSLSVTLEGAALAFVGVPLRLSANVENEYGKAVEARVSWNFGDGVTGEGHEAHHTYTYEGEYVVNVSATHSVGKHTMRAQSRMVVRVHPLALTVTHVDTFSIEITNEGQEEVDLSGFFVTANGSTFRIPQGTYILPGRSVRLPAQTSKLVVADVSSVGVFTPTRTLAARYGGADISLPSLTEAVVSDPATATTEALGVASEAIADEPEEVRTAPFAVATSMSLAQAESLGVFGAVVSDHTEAESASMVWWLMGVVGLSAIAGIVVMLMRHEKEDLAAQFAIEEYAEDLAADPIVARRESSPRASSKKRL